MAQQEGLMEDAFSRSSEDPPVCSSLWLQKGNFEVVGEQAERNGKSATLNMVVVSFDFERKLSCFSGYSKAKQL